MTREPEDDYQLLTNNLLLNAVKIKTKQSSEILLLRNVMKQTSPLGNTPNLHFKWCRQAKRLNPSQLIQCLNLGLNVFSI